MSNPGWPHAQSPFHAGERAIQERVGVREKMDTQGRRVIRDYLTEQHRTFFPQLPFLIAGTLDAQGQPWASVLVGPPGFLSSPDPQTLRVDTSPLWGDPLVEHLNEGADIGLLGIELHTRRRNRLNGTVLEPKAEGFTVQVGQSFGNCPQYIQAREFVWEQEHLNTPKPHHNFTTLGAAEQAMLGQADTFFIATAFEGQGVDVSHRGGKPGFVRVNDAQTLTIPDFAGNLHFNTVGNLLLNPRAGLLFIDFERGDLLYLTGEMEVIWDGAELQSFTGAERLLRFHLTLGRRVEESLPLRWSQPNFSPFLDKTGSWAG